MIMNFDEIQQEIFDCEQFDIFNRLWLDDKIQKGLKNEDITKAEKLKLYELIADEMEREGRI